MRYLAYLILNIIWLAASPAGAQTNAAPGATDEPRYRVELIVLMHLDHGEEARRMRWLEDYSAALDLLTPEPEDETADMEATAGSDLIDGPAAPTGAGEVRALDPTTPADLEAAPDDGSAAGEPGLEGEGEVEVDPLGGVVHVPELGAQMQDAWRRLRLSGPFRPLQYLAWEQGASAPFPTLRVHDEEAVLVQDPWAEERAALEAAAATTDEPPTPTFADETAPGDAEQDALPPPIRFYRLDGTAQLTRSRFLHLALSVEWREPVYDPAVDAGLAGAPAQPPERSPAGVAGPEDAMQPPPPDAFDIHRLEQSRQVRLRRMEYFDSPVLGVLAWVTRVNATTGEEEQAVDEMEMAWVE